MTRLAGAVLLAVVVAACSASPPTASIAPTTQPAATATLSPSPASTDVARLHDGKLQRGTYQFTGFQPWVEVTVGEGWEVGHFHDDFFDLFLNGGEAAIGFGRFRAVKHPDGTTVKTTSAEAIVTALKANPQLGVTDVGSAAIAGLTGRTIDVRATAPDTPLFESFEGDFKFNPNYVTRWHILDLPDGALEIVVVADPGKLDETLRKTQPVQDSLRVVSR